MLTIGERLLQERLSVGMSQTEFASAGGVGKNTQIKYEKDERSPDAAYLAAVAGIGVDVAYVLTGNRSGRPALAPDQSKLLDAFSSIAAPGRYAALVMLDALASSAGAARPMGLHVAEAAAAYQAQSQGSNGLSQSQGQSAVDAAVWVQAARALASGPSTPLSPREWIDLVDHAAKVGMMGASQG